MKTEIKRRAFLLVLALAVFLFADRAGQAQVLGPAQGARIPDFVSIAAGQECPSWCWAASVEMVARSQGVELPQELVVRKIYGPTLPCLPSGNIQTIVAAIQGVYRREDGATVAIRARAFYGNQGYAAPLIRSIQSGRPFIFLTRTHAMVAVGVHWSEVLTNWGQPTGYVQILDIELIDPYFTFGAQEFNTFYVRPEAAAEISGAIEIQSIELSEPDSEPQSDQTRERASNDTRAETIRECMDERPDACVDVCIERTGRSEAFCRNVVCRSDDPVNIRSWRRLCERRAERERERSL